MPREAGTSLRFDAILAAVSLANWILFRAALKASLSMSVLIIKVRELRLFFPFFFFHLGTVSCRSFPSTISR